MDLKDYLFLFDIDGTILDTRGDGKKALIAALQEALKAAITKEFSLLGGIDLVFFKYFYEQFSLPATQLDDYWNSFKTKYQAEMRKLFSNPWQIFPDAYQTIVYLHHHSQIALATGNIKIGADIKLEKFHLNEFFHCGGYGDNAENRTELVRNALVSAADFYKRDFDKKNIYLFGDTEKDVGSALENGIVPVLIDYRNLNKENAKTWNAKYYGTFSNFANFLKILENQSFNPDEVIYF